MNEQLELSFEEMLKESLTSIGKEAEFNAKEVAQYAIQRAEHLSTIVGETGFEEALLAERDNVALKAGIYATRTADLADHRLLGAIQGTLSFASKLIVAL